MKFSHKKSWTWMEKTMAAKLPAKEAWNKFIDYHEKSVPKPYWAALRKAHLPREQAEVVKWLEKLVTKNPLPAKTVALWIGIMQLLVGKKVAPGFYLIGANTYSAKGEDWACDPKYLPKNRYAVLKSLKKIDNIIRKDKADDMFLDWIMPLAYMAFLLDDIIRNQLDKKLFLNKKKKLYVTVGHDSGDFVNLSSIE